MAKVSEPANAGNITFTTEGKGRSARTIGQAAGIELSIWGSFGDQQPRIRDIDAAEALGFKRPRKIRELIERTFPASERPNSRPTVGRQSAGRSGAGIREFEVNEYWLTRTQLLKVIARSRTPIAEQVLDQMIEVFEAFLDGIKQIPPPVRAPRPTIRGTVEELAVTVGQLATAVSTMADAVSTMVGTMSTLGERVERLEGQTAPRQALPAPSTPRRQTPRLSPPKAPLNREQIFALAEDLVSAIERDAGMKGSPVKLAHALGIWVPEFHALAEVDAVDALLDWCLSRAPKRYNLTELEKLAIGSVMKSILAPPETPEQNAERIDAFFVRMRERGSRPHTKH